MSVPPPHLSQVPTNYTNPKNHHHTNMAFYDSSDGFATHIDSYPPFRNPVHMLSPRQWGVIRITNIPYSVTIQEINHFITRLTRGPLLVPHIHGYPIHIIIERPTGKTLEVYAEFQTIDEAQFCVVRAENSQLQGKALKIGQRHVVVSLSNQAELMSVLFPRAKCVQWDIATGAPKIVAGEDQLSEGFRGFFSIEEMASLVKHAETPQRSPFSARCMQRTYECMISTLYKFPWQASERYTLAARNYLFTTYMAQLRVLVAKIVPVDNTMVPYNGDRLGPVDREVGLNHQLLMDFLFAGLNVPSFSLRQKFQITVSCGPVGNGFPLSPHAFAWPFQCLTPTSNTSDTILGFWLRILSDGYEMASNNKLPSGYEKYLQVHRDYRGFLVFEFTHVGHGLHFQDAMALEHKVMMQMINRGRMRWCMNTGTTYHPLDMDLMPTNIPSDDYISDQMDNMKLGGDDNHGQGALQEEAFGKRVAGPLVVRSKSPDEVGTKNKQNAFSSQHADVDKQLSILWNKGSGFRYPPPHGPAAQRTVVSQPSVSQEVKKFAINPRSPAFIPSHAWKNNNGNEQQGSNDYDDDGQSYSPVGVAFHDPFTGKPIPQPRPIRNTEDHSSATDDSLRGGSSNSNDGTSKRSSDPPALDQNHDPIRRGDGRKPDTLFHTVSKSRSLRKACDVDPTIDEEGEEGRDDYNGGVSITDWASLDKSLRKDNGPQV